MLKKILVITVLVVLLINCNQKKEYQLAKTLSKSIILTSLSKNYKFLIKKIKKKHHKVSFFNKSKKKITAGTIFQFRTKTAFYVTNVEISNFFKNNPQLAYYFKLYVNDKLIGKYKTTETIKLNKKISSIRILFLKTEKEYLLEGWTANSILKFLRSLNNNENIFSPKIDLFIQNNQQINIETLSIRHVKLQKVLRLNKRLISELTNLNNLSVSGIHAKKDIAEIIQFSFKLYNNGSFSIYQLRSSRLTKKLISEVFYQGNWQCTKLNNGYANIEFDGKLSGYFSANKQEIIRNKQVKISSRLIGKYLLSDKILEDIYLDFPNDAFVNIQSLILDINIDMAYASSKNFTGSKLYSCNKCFLRYQVAKALMQVQSILKKDKMSLKLFDCYRPFSVQAIMFKKFPVPGYVADSIGGSIHNRGSAVDLSIVDENGKALDMGTDFDELSAKSNHGYLYFSDTILKNRLFLKNLMQANNFTAIRSEWWHYNYRNARKFPKVNDAFLCD